MSDQERIAAIWEQVEHGGPVFTGDVRWLLEKVAELERQAAERG